VRDVWNYLLSSEQGQRTRLPTRADRYALTRFTVTSPSIALPARGGESTQRLRADGIESPADPYARLRRFLSASAGERVCACGCGRVLGPQKRKWYNDAHRKRAQRR
jgi:hypothetical protein